MGKQAYVFVAAALLILAGLGAWIWNRSFGPAPPAPGPQESVASLYSRALLKVEADVPGDADETRWLEGELRYLLTRGHVAMAKPQGPYDAEDGATLFMLRVTGPDDPSQPLTLSLIAPSGSQVRTTVVPAAASRLGRMEAVAAALAPLLPRGDTGVEFPAFLGTTAAEAYETLAQVQMHATGNGELLQSQIAASDTPIDQLETLTREYPDFARAWSELALLYLRIEGKDAASLTAIAERAAQRALALDPMLADAHAVLGIARQRRGEWLTADTSLAAALALDPAAPAALEAFSCLLVDVGRVRYAKLIGEQAVAVSPGSEQAAECLGFARLALGEPAVPTETTSLSARRPRALMALLSSKPDAARELLAPPGEAPDRFNSWFAVIAHAIERPEERPAALQAITRAASDAVLDPATEILYGVALRQPDFVFNRLQRLKAQREETPTRMLWVKDAAFLQEHPRFAATTRLLGLGAYWKERERPDFCREEPAACP